MTHEITLLGEVGITRSDPFGGRPHALNGDQARVAFALLTLERNRGVTLETLAEAMWAGRLPSTWRSAVRCVVSRLRSFVKGVLPESVDPIQAKGRQYVLRLPEATVVDLDVAEQATTAAQDAAEAGEHAEAVRLAVDATTYLRAAFLPGQEGSWIETVRAHISELLLTALETASRAAAATGDLSAALASADEAARRAPLRESAHRLRMAAHAAAGNRGEALRAYQHLRRLLATELGVDPAPETEAAHLDLLSPALSARSTGGTPRPGLVPHRSGPFVGREAELAALSDAWLRATQGARQVAVLSGPSGMGKTHLAIEVARRVVAEGGGFLVGASDPHAVVPYQPFAEMLDGHLSGTPGDQLPELGSQAWDQLAGILPSLDDRRGAGGIDRATLYGAVTSMVRKATADRPVLALLDDLQWADEDSLLLLQHLIRHTVDSRLLVVAISRNGLRPNPLMAELVGTLRGSGALHHLAIGPLDEIDVESLVRHYIPETEERARWSQHLFAETFGHPLLLLELLRSTAPGDGPAIPQRRTPHGILDLVGSTVATLGPLAARLVRAASVAVSPFEFDVARHTAELSHDEALDALDTVLASGLLVESPAGAAGTTGTTPPRYRFMLDLVRRAVYDQLSGPRRRQLHGRWADAVEALHQHELEAHASELAHHRAAAADGSGDRRAVGWARVAARSASDRRSLTDEMRLRHQALAHVPGDDAELRAEVRIELGLAQAKAGDNSSVQTLIDGALRARGCGRLELTARAVLAIADLARTRSHLRSTAAALLHDVAIAKPSIARSAIGELLYARLVARLVELGETRGVPASRLSTASTCLSRHLQRLVGLGSLQERAELARDLATVAGAGSDPGALLVAAHHAAMEAAFAGDWPAVERALHDLADAAGHEAPGARPSGPVPGDRRSMGALLVREYALASAVRQGRLDASVTGGTTAGEAGAADRDRPRVVPAPGTIAPRQRFVARWLRGAMASDRRHGDMSGSEGLEAPERVLTMLVDGDIARGQFAARALARDLAELPGGERWLHEVALLALAAVECGDRQLADVLRELLAPHAERPCGVGYRSFVGTARFHLGRLAVVVGDWPEAERHLAAASKQLMAIGARPWLVLAQHSLASALAARSRAFDLSWTATLQNDATEAAEHLGLGVR